MIKYFIQKCNSQIGIVSNEIYQLERYNRCVKLNLGTFNIWTL